MPDLPAITNRGELPSAIPASELDRLQSAEITQLRPPLSIMGDVQISRYGAIGLAFLDAAPENRVTNWNHGSDYYGYEGSDKPDSSWGGDTEDDPRYHGTRKGLKLVRHTIIPAALSDVLATNKWVGPAVLAQALEDGVTPSEFREEPISSSQAFLTTNIGCTQQEAMQVFKAKAAYLNGMLPLLDNRVEIIAEGLDEENYAVGWSEFRGFPRGHRSYISFHPWISFGTVNAEAPGMLARSLSNIDALMRSVVDKDGVLEEEIRGKLAEDPDYLQVAPTAVHHESGPKSLEA